MNIAYLDIENSKTQEVVTLSLKIISNNNDEFEFDLSSLSENQLGILLDAINEELKYTDIELFYIGDSEIPYFGPDYKFTIQDGKLVSLLKNKNHTYNN